MIEMEFEVNDLLATLKKNRAIHIANAEKAHGDYKAALHKLLQAKIQKLEAGNTPSVHIPLTEPFNFVDDYDEVIAMLEMTSSKTIKLANQQFNRYVKDNWPRKEKFQNLSTSYTEHLL